MGTAKGHIGARLREFLGGYGRGFLGVEEENLVEEGKKAKRRRKKKKGDQGED